MNNAILTITSLLNEERCYAEIRNLRWPSGVTCPHCESDNIIKKGHHDKQVVRQRYLCNGCGKRFDDLSETIFASHHQPITVWVLCLYLMGLNISNAQIAEELDQNLSDTQQMCSALRDMVNKKKYAHTAGRSRI